MSTSPITNPLGYQGVQSRNPPAIWYRDRDPDMVTFKDFRNYEIGDFWQNTVSKQFFMLVSTAVHQGIWEQLTNQAGAGVSQLTGDDALPVTPIAGNINVYGKALGAMAFSRQAADTLQGEVRVDGVTMTINGANQLVSIGAVGFAWSKIAVNTPLLVQNGYIINGVLALTLPAAAVVGDVIKVVGLVGGWTIGYGRNQLIHFFDHDSTATIGSIASTKATDTVELVCTATNLEWSAVSSGGNITVT